MDYDREVLLAVLVALKHFIAGLAQDDSLRSECEALFERLIARDTDLYGMGIDGPLLRGGA